MIIEIVRVVYLTSLATYGPYVSVLGNEESRLP